MYESTSYHKIVQSRVGDRQPPFLATVLLREWATKVSVAVGLVLLWNLGISQSNVRPTGLVLS